MLFEGLARRVRGGRGGADATERRLIGDWDRVVACPGCGRPLADGQGRCPGCGALLIAGVRLRTAGFLILVGCALGMIGGALVAGAAMAPRLAAGDAAIAAAAGNAPAAANAPAEPRPSIAVPVAIALPQGVTGGLLQLAAVNARLAAYGAELDAALGAGSKRAAEIAVLLRQTAAEARAGRDAARRLVAWEPAAGLVARASGLYGALMTTATKGLAAPLADRAAYAAAGRALRSNLDDLPAVADATRAAAILAGLDLAENSAAP